MAFRIVRNDITKVKADAIVNTANPEPVYMEGTDSAIYNAAGAERLLKERKKAGRIEEGEVAVTPAFDLDVKYIFHTVGPVWNGGNEGEREIVRNCYLNCLNKAKELELESIAFPLISTGIYGFPKADALLTATSVFSSFLAENELDITLVVFDNESFELSDKIYAGIDRYIDENYVEEKTAEEYFGMASAAACGARMEPLSAAGALDEEAAEDKLPEEEFIQRQRERRRGLLRNRFKASVEKMQPCNDGMPAVQACAAMPAQKERSLEDVVKNVSESWSESLLRLIDEKGFTDTEVYKRANVDRKLFSKIRSNKDYRPKKNTAVAFALALKLNADETKDFLRKAGYAFSPSSVFDLIIEYFIENDVYDLMVINMALFEHGQTQLGD